MATITATTPTSTVVRATLVHRGAAAVLLASPVHGLPQMRMRGTRARCSSEEKASAGNSSVGIGASAALAAAASVMGMGVSSPAALALVDDRMSTEGTGLSLGLSNNLLGWILLGVFGLIWALFFVYTSTLEEDEESGLSL